MQRKLRISKYLSEFYPDDGPTKDTVLKWIKSGKIKGEKVGGLWYVVIGEPESDIEVLNLVKMLEAA